MSCDWTARNVFLNPPYGIVNGKSQAGLFIAHMADNYERDQFPEGITLVNSCTGAKWFKPLFKFPICFVDHRIRFDVPPLTEAQQANHTTVKHAILRRAAKKSWPKLAEKLKGMGFNDLVKYYYSQNRPTKENVFAYMGNDIIKFEEVFSEIGTVK